MESVTRALQSVCHRVQTRDQGGTLKIPLLSRLPEVDGLGAHETHSPRVPVR